MAYAQYCSVCGQSHIISTGGGCPLTERYKPQYQPNVTLTLWPKEWGEYLERIAIALEELAGISVESE